MQTHMSLPTNGFPFEMHFLKLHGNSFSDYFLGFTMPTIKHWYL